MNRDQAAHEVFGLQWAEVQARAAAYIVRAEADVVHWEWVAYADELPEEPVPVRAEPLRPLAAEPAPDEREAALQIGFDANDDIVVVRYFTDHWDGSADQLGVLVVEAVRVDGVVLRFVHEREGRRRHHVVLQQLIRPGRDPDGRLDTVREWNRGREEASVTRYAWDGERPAHAIGESFARVLGDPAALVQRVRYDYDYDAGGLARIRVTTEHHRHVAEAVGHSHITWIRSSDADVAAAGALVLEQLPQRIRAWAARVAPAEPVFALGLVHSLDNPGLPPAVALGTLSELRALRKEYGGTDMFRWRLFSTYGFECWDGLADELTDDAELNDAYARLARHWSRTRDEDEPEAILRACARRLLELDWTEVLTPAEQFVIFVMADDVGDDVLEHVEATVPADVIRAVEALA